MEMKEFAQKVLGAVGNALGEEYTVGLKTVIKNNGVRLQGLQITAGERNIVPVIYLEYFLAAYEDGVTMTKIVEKILQVYREEVPELDFDVAFFRKFENVRERICYRLIRRDGNEELLADIPYVEFLDLAICFFYSYPGEQFGEGVIVLHNSHLDMWKVSIKELMKLAEINTPRIYPGELKSMAEIMRESVEYDDGEYPEDGMLEILTNTLKSHGAACLLYPRLLEKIASKRKESFYIIPSSVHEVLLLKDTGEVDAINIRKIIKEINERVVAREEILSDNLYFYDFSSKSVRIIF